MDPSLINLATFLLGAACGAALSYLKDRRLLQLYSDLVRQLSGALQQQVEALQGQVEHALAAEAGEQTRWLRNHPETVRQPNAPPPPVIHHR